MGKRVQVRIPEWDAYNEKRKDVTKPSWLRLEKNLPRSKSLFGVKAADRYVFVTLLCLACDEQSADLDFDSEWFAFTYGCGAFSEAELLSAVTRLDGKVIEVKEEADTTNVVRAEPAVTDAGRERDEPGPSTSLYDTRRDDTRRTKRDDEEAPAAPATMEFPGPKGIVIVDCFDKVCSRLHLGDRFRKLWRARTDEPWLTEQLRQLETELDAPGNPYAQKPTVVRANEYLEKRLKKRGEPTRASPSSRYGPDVPTVEEFAKGGPS